MSNKKKKKNHIKKETPKKVQKPDAVKEFFRFIDKLSAGQFNILAILIIIIAGYLAYSNSFHGEMIFDDINIIQQNETLHDLGNYSDLSNWLTPTGRPLAMFSFALNYSFHENNVFGFHLVNFIIHLLFGIFVFLLARLILSINVSENLYEKKYQGIIAFFIALICVIHPIQTQAVSYIVQRMASMAAMFYVMSVFFYGFARIKYSKHGNSMSIILLYLLSALSGALGLLSKQNVITLPVAILLFELFFVRNKNGQLCKKYLLISSGLIVVAAIVVIFGGFIPKETDTISRSEYLFTQFRVIIKYIQLLFLPFNQALDYNFPISYSLIEWKVIVSLVIILLILIAGVYLFKKKPLVSFGIFWFFLSLSVESSILPIQDVIVEHRLYLPMFGFSILFVSLIWDLFGEKRITAAILFFVVVSIIFGIATYYQNKAWETKLSLWLDNTQKKPTNARAFSNLGSTYITLYDYNKAEEAYEEAVNLDSTYSEALFNLGNVKIDLGKLDEAVEVLTKLIKLDPTYHKAYFARGTALTSMQKHTEALADFERSLTQKDIDLNSSVYNKSGLAKLSLRQFRDAIEYFDQSIELKNDFPDPYNNKGLVFLEMKSYDSAIIMFTKAIELNPQFFEAYNNRGNAYVGLKLYNEALNDYSKALELRPNQPTILKNIAVIHYYLKNYPQAIEVYTQILSITPQAPNILNDRGITYYLMQDYEKAYTDMVKARQMGVVTNQEIFSFLEEYMISKNQ
jgi:tetratricopeptide (TPR) repeat protein